MLIDGDFRPAWWLPGAHLQTLAPTLMRRRPPIPLRRQRLELPDGDFIDLDWAPEQPGPRVILFHGLEGSSRSPYAGGLMRRLHDQGFQALTMHFRGCSGEPNRLPRSYFAGDTGDMAWLVDHLLRQEPTRPVAAIGVSLGGNALLKWLGETGPDNPLAAAVAISVPFDLDRSARRMEQGLSRFYQWYLVGRLKRSALRKCRLMPMPLDCAALPRLRTFREFDDAVTAPLHGFADVDDYYTRCSSRPYLRGIRCPTLILHARDDPFMTPETVPTPDELSPSIRLELSRAGGHVGFVEGVGRYWPERRIGDWLGDIFSSTQDQNGVTTLTPRGPTRRTIDASNLDRL
ncbi:hydrolase [Ectothiorhodospira shaposhnikovii]|uniref:hydrolase n=1 Tax=Ectothiorhodospira shaposhnikovii TaxID=1054 RepID=UPI001EE824FA|nr:hydrolase [Ectothiorhodospira shaposhnikovii]MCG5511815.1 hydrolase [Ectothiorhodospira shaposhnikovii]